MDTRLKQFVAKTEEMISVEMTPELAALCLEHARPNRKLRMGHVRTLARQMKAGQWNTSVPQPIGFDRRGRLSDGQHRCAAIVMSGVTIELWCALGLSEEAILKLDGGKQRSNADRLFAFTTDPVVAKLVAGNTSRAQQASGVATFLHQALAMKKDYAIDTVLRIIRMFHIEMGRAIDALGTVRYARRSAVLAAFTLAWYYAESSGDADAIERLERCQLLLSSGANLRGTELTLHRYLTQLLMRTGGRHRVKDSEWIIFTKTLRALQSILSGEPGQAKLLTPTKPRKLFWWFLGDPPQIARTLRIEAADDDLEDR